MGPDYLPYLKAVCVKCFERESGSQAVLDRFKKMTVGEPAAVWSDLDIFVAMGFIMFDQTTFTLAYMQFYSRSKL